jgi:hypothetical protein
MKLYKYRIMYGSDNNESGLIKAESEKSAYQTIWSLTTPNADFNNVWFKEKYIGWPFIYLEEITDKSFDANGMFYISD